MIKLNKGKDKMNDLIYENNFFGFSKLKENLNLYDAPNFNFANVLMKYFLDKEKSPFETKYLQSFRFVKQMMKIFEA